MGNLEVITYLLIVRITEGMLPRDEITNVTYNFLYKS